MPTKDTKEAEAVPTTNVKAGFPGTTLQSVSPSDPGAQPSQPPQDPENPQAGQEGPSASSRGGHVIDDGSEPLPGQPMKDSGTAVEPGVRNTGVPLKGGAQDDDAKKKK